MSNKVYYCEPEDVRRQLGIDSDAISDDDALEIIKIAQEEVDALTHTTFFKVQDSGTADADSSVSALEDDTKNWITNDWDSDDDLIGGYAVWIYSGTGAGQIRVITSNDSDTLNVSPDFDTAPDDTSKYRIIKNTYTDETFDGDGTEVYFTKKYPLLENPISLTIDSTDNIVSDLYVYKSMGKIELSSDNESSYFADNYPRLCNIKYFYGVFPFDNLAKELCAVLGGIIAATYMIGGTYTFATNYSIPDMSVSKGVPYPHFNTALQKLEKKRDWLLNTINNKLRRPMFG
jgi:hypothetical protein